MIRKLASSKYRLYSRKKNPQTGKRRNLGTFTSRAAGEARARRAIFQAGMIPRGFPGAAQHTSAALQTRDRRKHQRL
jgi:hypothetical protein